MPLNIPYSLPAYKTLDDENIFIISEEKAAKQDIRPLEVAILNLMPTKAETETQLLRLLSNTPLQVNVKFIRTSTYTPKHDLLHIDEFYVPFAEIKPNFFDALIITGAPVEHLPFEQVSYWKELEMIMEWSKTNVFSTLHICWGAQAGLFYHYGIKKSPLKEKLSGIYPHNVRIPRHPLMKGFDEVFVAPHSRKAQSDQEGIKKEPRLSVIADSEECGAVIAEANGSRMIFISGHIEYDKDTLKKEYFRDVERGLNPKIPFCYFSHDNPELPPKKLWTAHASLFYYNWLNLIYQKTPYKIENIGLLQNSSIL